MFHSSGPQRLALVATEMSVIAGVDLRSGSIAWRQILRADETVSVFQEHGKSLLSVGVCHEGVFVRLWSMQGNLLWDAFMPGGTDVSSAAPSATVVGNAVFVSWSSSTCAFQRTTGANLWYAQPTSPERPACLTSSLCLHYSVFFGSPCT